MENIREFLSAATEFEQNSEDKTLAAFLENVALVTDLDNQESAPDYVTMMTLHSAKGLEYDAVFMAGMEEGVFPSARAVMEENRLEEERRLCYVGVTRARYRLYDELLALEKETGTILPDSPTHLDGRSC